jgi:broad specificity phosphatase PhoE
VGHAVQSGYSSLLSTPSYKFFRLLLFWWTTNILEAFCLPTYCLLLAYLEELRPAHYSMAVQIHLLRHAEAVHNLYHDKTISDPPLTSLGHQEATKLGENFPRKDKVGIILTSPLKRAIETALDAFSPILDKSSPRPVHVNGIEGGAQFVIYPEVQPVTDIPSDIGSNKECLEEYFPGLDFSTLNSCWPKREGEYKDDDAAIAARGQRVRDYLAQLVESLERKKRCDIVLVTHGVVRDFVGEDHGDQWDRPGWLSYVVQEDEAGFYKLHPINRTKNKIQDPHRGKTM